MDFMNKLGQQQLAQPASLDQMVRHVQYEHRCLESASEQPDGSVRVEFSAQAGECFAAAWAMACRRGQRVVFELGGRVVTIDPLDPPASQRQPQVAQENA